ncbi:MAG: hypothetical protein ACK41F_00865 [Fimbriimonadaceae bacterium]
MNLENPTYVFIKMTAGVLATVGLYSVLYKETKLYRFFEHMFLGLAAGWSLTAIWTDTLKDQWWGQMVGKVDEQTGLMKEPAVWPWAFVVPMAFMAYLIFSRKHNWISRIPLGLLIGLGAGQAFLNWFNLYGPQMQDSVKVLIPTTFSSLTVPPAVNGQPDPNVYLSQAINNLIFVATLLCVLSYFIFCTEFKSRFLKGMSTAGRLVLMVGFGAIFGSTVMTRFALFIDRMYFVWIEWLWRSVLHLS